MWTVRVCGAFYPLLHFAEITLRNALHSELAAQFGREDWWAVAPLTGHGQNLVKKAQEKVSVRKSAQNANKVVAKLTLGFWVSLVSETYDRDLWVPACTARSRTMDNAGTTFTLSSRTCGIYAIS